MILPYQTLKSVINGSDPMIISDKVISDSQIQPATVDCRIGDRAYRMSTAMLPKRNEKVLEMIDKYAIYDFEIKEGSILEPNACYIVPLREKLRLPYGFYAVFSPKSSTGRLDVFVRVLSDCNSAYDCVKPGYSGNLYLEIIPLSFMVGIAPDLELTQFRIKSLNKGINGINGGFLSDEELRITHSEHGLVYSNGGFILSGNDEVVIKNDSLYFHAELDREIVGFQAKKNPIQQIDLFRKKYYELEDFWIPVKRPKNGELVLSPDCFYLLTTKEKVKIPPSYAAEIVTYDINVGEFRTHYAGFFDNNFGGEKGTNVVLEVRVRDVPFRLYDGQPICRMVFEKTTEVPEKLYGADIGSHYTGSGPKLSKHFKDYQW